MLWNLIRSRMTLLGSCMFAVVGLTGCSVLETSHIQEPDPPLSVNAMASADGSLMAQPFSLVAADSVGLAAFGQELALWDSLYPAPRMADARSCTMPK